MTADAGQAGGDRLGPWTFRTCVTAACTRCGVTPLDDDTGLTPHFNDPLQAIDELTGDWGWRWTGRPLSPAKDELLCPDCQAADGDAVPAARTAPENNGDGGECACREASGQPCPEMPPNAAIAPRFVRRLS